jgi:hypothetical protein
MDQRLDRLHRALALLASPHNPLSLEVKSGRPMEALQTAAMYLRLVVEDQPWGPERDMLWDALDLAERRMDERVNSIRGLPPHIHVQVECNQAQSDLIQVARALMQWIDNHLRMMEREAERKFEQSA